MIRLFLFVILLPQVLLATHLDYPKYRNLLDTGRIQEGQKLRQLFSVDEDLRTFFQFHEAFYGHQFEEAASKYQSLMERNSDLDQGLTADLFEIVLPTRNLSLRLKKKQFDRFVMYYEGVDEILTLYAEAPLNEAFEYLNQAFDHSDLPPVRIDIVPSWTEFERVTPLTEEEIRTSGTIALCKYNRLIVTTPRALLRGYDWIDTIVHEYIHYLLNLVSEGRAPVWLHEGIAKYFERRWRDSTPQLEIGSRTILARYLEKDALLPFESFHPSIAKLPSQELAQLAFAQAFTFIQYLVEVRGDGTKLLKVLQKIASGTKVEQVFEKFYGASWKQLQADWKKWLGSIDLKPSKFYQYEERTLVDSSIDEKAQDQVELGVVENEEIQRAVQLGDLLREKGRYRAALYEYRKGLDARARAEFPILARKVASTMVALGNVDAALKELERALRVHPSHPAISKEMGLLWIEKEKWKEAKEALLRSNHVNPYDPAIHHGLLKVLERLDLEEEAKRERKVLTILSSN